MSAQPTTPPRLSPARVDALIRANYGKVPVRRLAPALGLTSAQVVGHARRLGLIVTRPWTERERRLLRRRYDPDDPAAIDALAAVLGRSRHNVAEQARTLGLGRAVPRWTPEDDAYLRAHYGYRSLAAIGAKLGRSAGAVREHAWALRLRRHRPFTLSAAARLVGWDWHKVALALAAGDLAGSHGTHRSRIDPDALERFLVGRCAEIDPARMADPSGYYVRLVREARDADPLLTVPQVAARLGVSCDRIRRLIRAGRIEAVKAQNHGGKGGTYYVRQSRARYEHLPRGWPKGKPRRKGASA